MLLHPSSTLHRRSDHASPTPEVSLRKGGNPGLNVPSPLSHKRVKPKDFLLELACVWLGPTRLLPVVFSPFLDRKTWKRNGSEEKKSFRVPSRVRRPHQRAEETRQPEKSAGIRDAACVDEENGSLLLPS